MIKANTEVKNAGRRANRLPRPAFSTGPYPATTTKLRFESTGGNAFSISSRYVTSFLACVLLTFATALFVGFVGGSLTKPAQLVDIFFAGWDF